jgi:nucleotide-binding universal stress UspA family protein
MFRTPNRILYCTDLSHNSTFAFHYAMGMARALDAEVHVLHVVEPLSEDARVTLSIFLQDPKARDTAIAQRLDTLSATLRERQAAFWSAVPENQRKERSRVVATDVVEGHAADAILREVERRSCDIILIGAHAHGLGQTFLGTIAKRVLRRARVPTLVIPYNEETDGART